MTKRVFIIHGWDGSPKNFWLAWLGKELKKRKIKAILPKMPNADKPTIKNWIGFLAKKVGKPDKDTYFVGHSIACQMIMRYLETLSENIQVGGAIFVAGFFNLSNLQTEEEKRLAKEWLETPIDLNKVKTRVKNQIVAIFSDNDPDVPLSDSNIFRYKLGSKVIVEHNKGHFSDDAGVTELPVVLEELLKLLS